MATRDARVLCVNEGASVCMGIQKFFIVEYNIETAKVRVLLIPNGILFTIMD